MIGHPLHRMLGLVLLGCALTCKLQAGGCGLNTIVVINQGSSNSCELGNYYCQQRAVPPQNVLYINWPVGNSEWGSNDLEAALVTPLLNLLASEQLTNQIRFVVLSMDIPFQTAFGSTVNSTTSALFYGLRLGNGSDPLGTTNSYAASESNFSQNEPVGAPGYAFLTTMITDNSLAGAKRLVDRGGASDGTFPASPVVLAKTSDTLRNVRYVYFDNAIFNAGILGLSPVVRENSDCVCWSNTCSGFETGLADFSVPAGLFVPGAMADSLTSFGGVIFGGNSQTNELAFIDAGATASYGTVAEPENDTQKFPNPQVYFYQARGYTVAESYYQSVNVPYLGLMVAEPLAAPFAQTGSGRWSSDVTNAILSGTTNLSLKFKAAGNHPLQRVDLFVDGVYYSTLTNLPPGPGNVLSLTLNGYPLSYTVPTNSTLSSIATGLAAQINAATNATLVKATAYGDRVQLQSTATNALAIPYYLAESASTNTGISYSVNYLPGSAPPQITPGAPGRTGAYTMEVGMSSALPYVILASTNLTAWQPIYTNSLAGLFNFVDEASTNYPARFYRLAWTQSNQPPRLSAPALAAGGFQVQVDGESGQGWAIQMSADLVNWVTVFTNQAGGSLEYVDTSATNSPARFYRGVLASPPLPTASVSAPGTNQTLVRVSNAALPYTIGVATNQGPVTVLATNYAIGQVQTTVANAAGSAAGLSTFLTAAQPEFLPSQACGLEGYTVFSGSPPTNAWIKFTFTLTNGQAVVMAMTNQSGADAITFANQMYNAINANPALQGGDGVVAEDFETLAGFATFNLYARSPGYAAAGIYVQPKVYKVVMSTPQGTLTQNLSDLQPRNHLYVTAGASSIALTFPLATTNLADGYHQLTAVAYEGNSVGTETLVSAPVMVRNTALSATMTLLDLTNSAPVTGTYHIQVAANTNTVNVITLYSTGGVVGAATNTATAAFQVVGTNLGAGVHPFYAVVKTVDGLVYRTQMQWVTLGVGD